MPSAHNWISQDLFHWPTPQLPSRLLRQTGNDIHGYPFSSWEKGGSRSELGQENRHDVVLIHTHFALQHQLCPNILWLSPCQHLFVSWIFLASGFQALPTDDSELYSVAHKNEPESHLQSPDAKNLPFDLKCFNNTLHSDALVAICSSLRALGTQRAVSLRIPKRSCKIVETLPCEMPNACAISSTWIRLSEYTRYRVFLHISSSVASVGRPDLASSLKTLYRVWILQPRI